MLDIIKTLKEYLLKYYPKATLTIDDRGFCNVFTNVYFKYKKYIGDELLNYFDFIDIVELINGYTNIFFKKEFINLVPMLPKKDGYIIFEYASPNPTGELHFGHDRNGIESKVYKLFRLVGYKVTEEMYINDDGKQIDILLESIKYYQGKSQVEPIYTENIVKEAANYFKNIELNKKEVIDHMVNKLKIDFKKIGIEHQSYVYESDLKEFESLVFDKILKDYIHKEILEDPVNRIGSKEESLVLDIGKTKSVIKRIREGTNTYFGNDILNTYYKVIRILKLITNIEGDPTDINYYKELTSKVKDIDLSDNFSIITLGEDHDFYSKKLLSLNKFFSINLKIFTYAFCFFKEDNKIKKFSKREGNIISVDKLLNSFSLEELHIMIYSRNKNMIITLDLEDKSYKDIYNRFKLSEFIINNNIVSDTNDDSILLLENHIYRFNNIINQALEEMDLHIVFINFLKLSEDIILINNSGVTNIEYIDKIKYIYNIYKNLIFDCNDNTI